jgi:hypothetical protein
MLAHHGLRSRPPAPLVDVVHAARSPLGDAAPPGGHRRRPGGGLVGVNVAVDVGLGHRVGELGAELVDLGLGLSGGDAGGVVGSHGGLSGRRPHVAGPAGPDRRRAAPGPRTCNSEHLRRSLLGPHKKESSSQPEPRSTTSLQSLDGPYGGTAGGRGYRPWWLNLGCDRPFGAEGPCPPMWRMGASFFAGPAGSGCLLPRLRDPLNDLAAVPQGGGGGHGQAGLTRERTGAGRCSL